MFSSLMSRCQMPASEHSLHVRTTARSTRAASLSVSRCLRTHARTCYAVHCTRLVTASDFILSINTLIERVASPRRAMPPLTYAES